MCLLLTVLLLGQIILIYHHIYPFYFSFLLSPRVILARLIIHLIHYYLRPYLLLLQLLPLFHLCLSLNFHPISIAIIFSFHFFLFLILLISAFHPLKSFLDLANNLLNLLYFKIKKLVFFFLNILKFRILYLFF